MASERPEDRVDPASEHWVQIEQSPRHVRVIFGGETIADSRRAMLLRERQRVPVYYVPPEDVRPGVLRPGDRRSRCPYKGDASYWTVHAGARVAENAAWSYLNPMPAAAAIQGYAAFQWNLMDAWFEEDEEVFVHARDPYKRVDVMASSRHVRVVLRGETIADTRRPRLLFETGLPTRYYISLDDIRGDRLVPSETVTRCPYKGIATYWSVRSGDEAIPDLAWSYRDPIAECPKIRGLVCFFQEREATVFVDGDEVPRTTTHWSR